MSKTRLSKLSISLVTIAIFIVCVSCDRTFEFLESSNFSRWSYSQTEGIYDNFDKDSVWRPKSQNSIRANRFTFYKTANRGNAGILITFVSGKGSLTLDGIPVSAGEIIAIGSKNQFSLTFTAAVTQTTDIVIHLQSAVSGQMKGEATIIRVHAFENRVPISNFVVVRQTDQPNGLYYRFDAGRSTDPDIRWGDNITIYSYTVVSSDSKVHTFFVDTPKIDYAFPDYDSYKVILEVRDANGGISAAKETVVNVTR